MAQSVSSKEKTALFQLKGGLYTLTALQLLSGDMDRLETVLRDKIQQAPKFFHQAPLIVDLSKLPSGVPVDFKALRDLLHTLHLVPVGIKGGNPSQQENAQIAGFAILPDHHSTEKKASPHKEEDKTVEFQSTPTRLITEPIRSGQQVYARGGDLIVLASVSQGSELLADGHIHVYGALRGRALAGVTGDTNARIFCQSLEAELISIAGQYKLSEDIEKIAWKVATEVSLQGERLQFRSL